MPGWLTIVLVTSFIGGIQLIVIGVVGEYVGRIYDEVKARPLYLVRELHGFEHEPIPRRALPPSELPQTVSALRRDDCRAYRAPCGCRSLPRPARSPSSSHSPRTSTTRDLHTYPNFDEGNYLGSMDALRHGQALGRDVFLDQPPGWYLLLVAVSYPFGNSVSGVRTGLIVVTLLAILAAYACGRLAAARSRASSRRQ